MAMTTTTAQARRHDQGLFGVMAAIVASIVFAGFARTYYLGRWFDAPALSPLVHWHGLLCTSWIALFGLQVGLVSTRRTPLHRRVGTCGAVLALAMVGVGMVTAVVAARHGHTPSEAIPPLSFLAIPLFNIATFAVLVAFAVALRRDAPSHKRLMLLATIGILAPAIARFPFEFIQHGGAPLFFALTDLLAAAAIVCDAKAQGHVPAIWYKGGALLVGLQIVSLIAAPSGWWLVVAHWLTA